jgi:pimeloyl-ACP methyl ester carboxylesterase
MADRPALILLHAWPLDARMWKNQVVALGADGAVVAPDLPGFGNEPAAPPLLDDWARRLSGSLRGRGVKNAVVAGCSMGGYVTLALLRVDPELLAGIALVSSRAAADTPVVSAARSATIDRIQRGGGDTRFLVEDSALALSTATRQGRPEVVAAVRAMAADGSSEALIAAYRAIGARPDMTAALAASGVPLTLIAGVDDPIVPIGEARALAASIPRATFTPVPDAGHISPMENPEVVTAALREFWNSIPAV